jgi:hypothetical protein
VRVLSGLANLFSCISTGCKDVIPFSESYFSPVTRRLRAQKHFRYYYYYYCYYYYSTTTSGTNFTQFVML